MSRITTIALWNKNGRGKQTFTSINTVINHSRSPVSDNFKTNKNFEEIKILNRWTVTQKWNKFTTRKKKLHFCKDLTIIAMKKKLLEIPHS